jgi:hypothetical protein
VRAAERERVRIALWDGASEIYHEGTRTRGSWRARREKRAANSVRRGQDRRSRVRMDRPMTLTI